MRIKRLTDIGCYRGKRHRSDFLVEDNALELTQGPERAKRHRIAKSNKLNQ